MRFWVTIWSFVGCLIFLDQASAFIPNGKFILEKTVGNGGTGAYVIEQDVIFVGAQETLALREIWTIENETNQRVFVRGPKELSGQISFQALYLGPNKVTPAGRSQQNSRLSEDFFERMLYTRRTETLANWLSQLKIYKPFVAPAPPPPPKSRAKAKRGEREKEKKVEFPYWPDPNVRLARIGGVTTWALGAASPVEGDALPGIWIEQDMFSVRKLRFPSFVEVNGDSFGTFARGLKIPQQRTVKWNQKAVQINVIKVTGLPANRKPNLATARLENQNKFEGLQDPELAQTIEEFYRRFR